MKTITQKTKQKYLYFDRQLCINCGQCTSVCFFDALSINFKTKKLIFNPQNCTLCGLCINTCPFGLFKIKSKL